MQKSLIINSTNTYTGTSVIKKMGVDEEDSGGSSISLLLM